MNLKGLVLVLKLFFKSILIDQKVNLFLKGLPLGRYLVAQDYDGASNMSGHIKGVAARIRSYSTCTILSLLMPSIKLISSNSLLRNT